MSIFKALRAFLLADAPIAANVGTRIYPDHPPQGATYPLIVIRKVDGPRLNLLHGRASAARPRYQIDAWTKERAGVSAYDEVLILGGFVLDRLEAYVGTMTDVATSPATVFDVQVEFSDDREFFESDVSGGYWRHSADYFIHHSV